ncbi:MAG TPA: MMPL family transporter [Actinomycetes bacterium]|jgi:RND superfamily putative drug exporter|nr:MMPL family transporter [Actinomycetes bacterium]
MTRLPTLVLRHKRLVVLFWLTVTAAGLAVSPKLSGHLSQQFTLPGQPAHQANLAILRSYGNGGPTLPLVGVVTAPPGGSITAPAARRALGRAFAQVASVPGVRVVSYATTGDPRFISADRRTSYGLVFPPPSAQLETRDPNLGPQVADALRQGLPGGWSVQVTGVDELASGGNTSSAAPGVLAEALLGALGALAVLAFVFGSLLALVPLLIAAVSILTAFLLILALVTLTEVSVLVQYLVALIGLGVAIDYCLLLVTRWREELARGHQDEQAVRLAMATAGRAVLFSGGTVAIGLVSLALLPVPLLRSIGLAGMLIPLVSVLATLTLLPALLAGVGRRLDWPRRRKPAHASRGWSAWARGVVRARWLAALAALAILVPLGIAAFGLVLGTPRADALATSGPARTGLVALEDAGLPTGILTPLEVLVPDGTDPTQVAGRLAGVVGVRAAVAPDEPAWRRGGTALVSVQPIAETSTPAGRQTIARVRQAATSIPGVQVGGNGPFNVDFASAVYGRFPLMVAIIAAVTFVLLARAFRSLLLPAKAVLLNLLSVGAIYGVLVLVWQDGHGSGLWGIPATGSTQTFIPLMVFAFLYGLSMDYEVFILARMREAHDRTGCTTTAIVEGIGRTGRLVTSAALILFLAFAALASGPEVSLKVFATGLGAGILLDATVVRALLVPALVSLLGRWNWWLPAWAARPLGVAPSPPDQNQKATTWRSRAATCPHLGERPARQRSTCVSYRRSNSGI